MDDIYAEFPISHLYNKREKRTLWLALLFGRRVVGEDSGTVVRARIWRGRIYVTHVKIKEPPHE